MPFFFDECRTGPSPAAPPTAPCSLPPVAARAATTSSSDPTVISRFKEIGTLPEWSHLAAIGAGNQAQSYEFKDDCIYEICGVNAREKLDIEAHL
jgi:hypothetical protein